MTAADHQRLYHANVSANSDVHHTSSYRGAGGGHLGTQSIRRQQQAGGAAPTLHSNTANDTMFLDSEPRLQNDVRKPRLRDDTRPQFTRTETYPQNPTIGDSTPTTTTTNTPDDHETTPTPSIPMTEPAATPTTEHSEVKQSDNTVTQRLLGPDGMNRLRISDETASAIVTDITPKKAKFDMGELRSHLEEDGEYTAPEVETIVTLYKNRHRSIHHRKCKTLVNNVLGLNDNMMAEICNVLKALLQFHRSAFRINIAFGKLLHSHKNNRAKYYHGSTHGRKVLIDTAPKISSLAHVNKVVNQIVRHDLGADLIHARENSNFRGVMYTNFVVYHVPVIVKNDIKGPRRSIRR